MPRSSSVRTLSGRRVCVSLAAILTAVLLTGAGAAALDAPGTVALEAGALHAVALDATDAAAPTPSPDPGLLRRDDARRPEEGHPVVLVGMAGVRWDDVQTLSTPALWDLSRRGSVGVVAARSVTSTSCPADGWLAVSSAARLADLTAPDVACRTLQDPVDGGVVPGWPDYLTAAGEQPYGARPGLLGDVLRDAGVEVTGIGPGAAIAVADPTGRPVGTHARRPTAPNDLRGQVRAALVTSQLVVVDAGTVRDAGKATERRSPGAGIAADEDPDEAPLTGGDPVTDPLGVDVISEPTRAEQVRQIDERVEAVLRAVRGSSATVVVVSLADSGRATLQLVVAAGPAPGAALGGPGAAPEATYADSLLTSGSTRQAGLVQATDVTATVLAALDIVESRATLAGAPILPVAGPATAAQRIDLVQDMATEARQVTRVSGSYLTRLVLTQAVLFVIAALLLSSGRSPREVTPLRRAMQVLKVSALALGAVPIASFLAELVPWWRATSPVTAFWLAVLGWTTVVTVLALAGPWRRALLGPAGTVAGVTVLVLVVDAFTGSTMVVDSPMGAHRIMAARFYGMSNQAFAMLAAAGLLLATAVAQPLLDRGRRDLATLAVVSIGVVVTLVDGLPGLGSDFGGPPALIPAFAVLALVVSGRRPRLLSVLLVVAVSAVVVTGIAWLDWLQPAADRTHLGRFFATVLDGGLWDVVARKLGVNLRVLTSWRYLLLAVGGILVTGLVLRGPHPRGKNLIAEGSPLSGLGQAVPLLSTCVAAVGLALGIGFLVNDSGIVIAATGIAVAVPCLIAAAAQARLTGAGENR